MGKNEMFEWVESIIIAIILAFLIKTFILDTTKVIGISMEPTLTENDRLFSNRIVLKFKEPEYGDVVVIKAPDSKEDQYIKRVIGVSGDEVKIIDGKVYINGEELIEKYIDEDSYTDIYGEDSWIVAEGQVFLLGDNREKYASKDSRTFGCIPVEDVKGINNFRYYPLNSTFGKINKK